MEKNFSELSTGTKFSVNGIEYVKTEEVRISCCKVVNAYASSDSSQKVQFSGDTKVVVNG